MLTCTVHAQSTDFIFVRGKITGLEFSEAVPYASVSVTGTNIGTAADAKGLFLLKIDNKYLPQQLKVSSIGYESSLIDIKILKDSALTIVLRPVVNMLNEVMVSSHVMLPEELIRESINKVPANFSQLPFNIEFFSKISILDLSDSARQTGQIESIIWGYSDGYFATAQRQFEITEARRSGKDPFDGFYYPTHDIYVTDIASNTEKFGVYNPVNFGAINFTRGGITTFDGDTIMIIGYDVPKPTKKVTGYGIPPRFYKGSLSINVKDLAIVKSSIVTDRFEYQIIYRKINKLYFPYSITSSKIVDGVYKLVYELKLNRILFDGLRKITAKHNEIDYSKIVFNKSFWDANYPKTDK